MADKFDCRHLLLKAASRCIKSALAVLHGEDLWTRPLSFLTVLRRAVRYNFEAAKEPLISWVLEGDNWETVLRCSTTSPMHI